MNVCKCMRLGKMVVRGSNPTPAFRQPLLRLGQPSSILSLVLRSGDMANRHWKSVTAEKFLLPPSFRQNHVVFEPVLAEIRELHSLTHWFGFNERLS
ncbi:hypothetical protein T265_09131 [Opisthorchis viverrini]|uniref:Uncharacterized protein n=1 Tax=Opisthorchis viverrini TaxID=6198 RepID=A0A074ZHU7_OPIVI|nr:hypothetical protein T265_09131 [Opisthorchis viverrini]KER22855.1 hypothetical protein T265_09131 [Opisthorchis viverrini]